MTELKWGETPWDSLSREDLIRQAQRMYSAIVSLYSIARVISTGDNSTYWGTKGVGGCAVEKARQIIHPIEEEFGRDEIYHSFFRYADDLLFERNGFNIGFLWYVCDKCGVMVGADTDKSVPPKDHCWTAGCYGAYRKMTWSDLAPKERT